MPPLDEDGWLLDEHYYGNAFSPSYLDWKINENGAVLVRGDFEDAIWTESTREDYESWAIGAWRDADEPTSFFTYFEENRASGV